MATWETVPNIPVEIARFGCVSLGDKIYCMGGWDGSQILNLAYSFDTVTQTWAREPDMPTPRMGLSCVVHNNEIWCLGGTSPRGDLTAVEVFDVSLKTWRTAPSMPIARSYFACGIIEGSIYCAGGFEGASLSIFNIATSVWSAGAAPKEARYHGAGVAVQGHFLYLGGHYDPLNKTMDIYDPIANLWRVGTELPLRKQDFGCSNFGEKVYCISGWDDDVFNTNQPKGQTNTLLIYDTVSQEWSYGQNAPTARWSLGTVVAGAKLFCIGGITRPSDANSDTTLSIVECLDLRTATISNPQPSAGFVNEQAPNRFEWELVSTPANAVQKSAQFQWREHSGSTVNTINITGPEPAVTVPAATFPNGSFQWRVKATNTDDIESEWSPWYTLTTIDQPPSKPTNLYPSAGSRDGTKPIQFSWIHNSPLSTPQSAFEVQATYDAGITWQALSGKTAASVTAYTVPADTLTPDSSGRVGWRVRTYNSDDVASPWSDAVYLIVLLAPDAPEWRSVETGKSRPVCEWIAPGQIAFQLQVLQGEAVAYDTGETYGPETRHKIADYLKNGAYTFQVRFKNQLGLWSDYAQRSVNINAKGRVKVSLNGEKIANGARLIFTVEVV